MPHRPETHPGGEWVPVKQVSRDTDVYGRAYRCEDGTEGIYWGIFGRTSPIAYWYFAPPEESTA